MGLLANNGGPTQTQKPSLTSPLLENGKVFAGFADQRGQARPFDVPSIANAASGDGTDIGAVELQAADFAAPPAPASPSTPAAPRKKCKKKKHRRSAQISKKCKKKKR